MEIGAPGLTLLSLAVYMVLGRRLSARLLLVLVSVLVAQLLLWLLRGSGEVVLYPWEYPVLYSAALWTMYSVLKALVTALVAGRWRRLGSWLLLVAVLQPILSGVNIVAAPTLHHAIVRLGGEQLRAVVADTRLRAECGYYCWPSAQAILFTYRHGGLVRITMIGVTRPLLLIEVVHGRAGEVVLLEPWHVYSLRVASSSYLLETRYTWLQIHSGEQVAVEPASP